MTRLIDADKLISAVKSNVLTTDSLKTYVEASVNAQPTVDAVPVRHGKWKVTSCYIKCSECGECFMLIPQNFCPACGARMDEDEEGSGEYDCIN